MRNTPLFSWSRWSLVALAFLAACSSTAKTGEVDLSASSTVFEAKPAISLVVNDWTASALDVAIAEQLIEGQLGYPVLPVRLDDSTEIYDGLADGSLDAILEIWPSNMSSRDQLYFERGQVLEIGPLGAVGKIGWFVPGYMVDDEPTLTSWEGFADRQIASQFASADSGTKGRLLGTNPDYRQFDQEIIDSLGLPLVVEFSGSEEDTLRELQAKTEVAEPILVYWWSPTSAVARFDLVNVVLPAPTEQCVEAMAGGPGRIDCDYPSDELFKATSADLQAKAPDVAAFLKRFTLSTQDQLDLLAWVEVERLTIGAAAAQWIDANEHRWREWLGP